jgi:pyrroloquinoline quinone biosynthesis protein B
VYPDQDRYYLVDATPDITRQLDLLEEPGFRARADQRRPFDGIFLTHAHIGHYSGLAVLGREGLGMAPTPTYCTPAMADFLTNNGPWGLMVSEGRLDLRPVVSGEWNRIDDQLQARALLVPHRPEYSDTVGWVFRGPTQTILYLPDIDSWERWELDVEDVVAAVDVALLDASFYSGDEVPGRNIEDLPHPLVPHSMDRLQGRVDAGDRVVFTHLNNTNPALPDSDGDNCTDGWEVYWDEHKPANETRGFDPLDASDGGLDYDDDGWEDWEGNWHDFPNWREDEAQTDPWDADSDDDGMSDGYEADN